MLQCYLDIAVTVSRTFYHSVNYYPCTITKTGTASSTSTRKTEVEYLLEY